MSDEALVEQRGDRVERRLVDRSSLVERDQGLLDGALAQDEDEAGHPLVDGDQVDPADVGVARLGRRGQAGDAGHRGERRRGEPEPVLAGELDLAELVADHQLLDRRAAARSRRSTRRRSDSRRPSGCARPRYAGTPGAHPTWTGPSRRARFPSSRCVRRSCGRRPDVTDQLDLGPASRAWKRVVRRPAAPSGARSRLRTCSSTGRPSTET